MKPEVNVVSELEKRLDVAHHLPSLRRLAIGVAIVVLAAFVVWPISAASRRGGVSSGAVSNHHRLIEAACEQCHAAPFEGVPDEQCMRCHNVPAHVASQPEQTVAHPDLWARCTSCHKEHHGDPSLVPTESPLCTGCHARMPGNAQKIRDLAHHPEFAVRAWSGTPPVLAKVALDKPNLRDQTQLKFSHDEHLGQVASNGKPALVCASCHQSSSDRKTILPINYAKHCERCHHIEFDDRIKDSFVPHGDTAGVVGFITAQVSKLHVEQLHGAGAETRALVAKETREDEIGLFTAGGACFKCHDVEEVLPTSLTEQSHYRVPPSNVPATWLPASMFSHDVHQLATCDSCHANVRTSTSASDILLPRIARCRECHADPGTPGKIASPCLECHRYHAAD